MNRSWNRQNWPTAVPALCSELFGFSSTDRFFLFLGLAIFFFIVFSNILSAFTVYARTRFVMGLNHELSSYLLTVYLAKPYPFFLNRNTSTLGKNLLAEVYQLTNGLLMPIFELVVNVLVAIALTLVLFISDPISAFAVLVVIGGCYVIINLKTRKKIRAPDGSALEANQGRYKTTGEALPASRRRRSWDARTSSSTISTRTAAASPVRLHPRHLRSLMPSMRWLRLIVLLS